jgi:hypothetical protein
MGVMLFLSANLLNPEIMNFSKENIMAFSGGKDFGNLRLDSDEKEHAMNLASQNGIPVQGKHHPHIETLHVHPETSDISMIPEHFREGLIGILLHHTQGFSHLENGVWVQGKS